MAQFFRVLSVDGGGIRGYIPALVLAEIERRAGRPVSQLFDLMVGTSTGGIVVIGASCGITAAELADFYPTYGRAIFGGTERSKLQKRLWGTGATLGESLGNAARTVGAWGGGNPAFGGNARHPAEGLERVLKEVIGERPLSRTAVDLAITSFDTGGARPVVFSRYDARNDAGFDLPLWQVARATSAAPTYFPPFTTTWLGTSFTFVDGGVWANNPSGVALAESIRAACEAGRTPADILIVSLGTGIAPTKELFAGTDSWIGIAGNLMALATNVRGGDVLAARALGEQYQRIQIVDDAVAGAMDDPSNARLAVLRAAAAHLIREEDQRLNGIVNVLTA